MGVGPQTQARNLRLSLKCDQGFIFRVAPEHPRETSPDLLCVHVQAIDGYLGDGSTVSVERLPPQLYLLLGDQLSQRLL